MKWFVLFIIINTIYILYRNTCWKEDEKYRKYIEDKQKEKEEFYEE